MTRKAKTYPARHSVSVEIDGKTIEGEYYIEGGMITVVPFDGGFPKTTQLGGHAQHPAALARLMLRELATR